MFFFRYRFTYLLDVGALCAPLSELSLEILTHTTQLIFGQLLLASNGHLSI